MTVCTLVQQKYFTVNKLQVSKCLQLQFDLKFDIFISWEESYMWLQDLWWTLCNNYWKCTYDATTAFVLGSKQVLYDLVQSKCNIPYDVFIHCLYCFVLVFLVVCERLRADWGQTVVFRFLCFLSMNYWPKPFFLYNTVIKCSSLNFPSISITQLHHWRICADSTFAFSMFGFRFFTAVKSGCSWAQVSGCKCLRDRMNLVDQL